MAAPEKTYDDAAIREDLANFIENISPVENWFLKNLQKTTAESTTHVNSVDTLKAPARNAVIEGADTTFGDRTRPTRVDNLTQIVEIPFSVSSTEQWVRHAGFDSRYAYEADKAMKEWGNDAERAVVRETRQSGNASTARRMDGIIAKVVTNVIDGSSTAVWNEDMLNDLSELAFWAGGHPQDLFLPPALKRKTSTFTQGDRQYDSGTGKKTNTVREYEGDFETLSVHKHRFINDQADTVFTALMLEVDEWAVSYGEKPFEEELSKTGNSLKGHVRGELTVEARAENSSAKAINVKDVA
jgi:hypothetical protein